jgi:hypothetical protein
VPFNGRERVPQLVSGWKLPSSFTRCSGGGGDAGTTNSLRRRPSAGKPVGMPFSSSTQWRVGSAKGLLRMGLSMTVDGTL